MGSSISGDLLWALFMFSAALLTEEILSNRHMAEGPGVQLKLYREEQAILHQGRCNFRTGTTTFVANNCLHVQEHGVTPEEKCKDHEKTVDIEPI